MSRIEAATALLLRRRTVLRRMASELGAGDSWGTLLANHRDAHFDELSRELATVQAEIRGMALTEAEMGETKRRMDGGKR